VLILILAGDAGKEGSVRLGLRDSSGKGQGSFCSVYRIGRKKKKDSKTRCFSVTKKKKGNQEHLEGRRHANGLGEEIVEKLLPIFRGSWGVFVDFNCKWLGDVLKRGRWRGWEKSRAGGRHGIKQSQEQKGVG